VPVACSGTLSNLYVTTQSNQSATGPLVLTLRRNASDCGLTVTFAAGAAPHTEWDLTNSCTVTDGDLLTMRLANSATANSAALTGWSMKLQCAN
jgi:hypothetical protein